MTAADSEQGRDLYQLLGVPRDASRAEIIAAWRHRALAEHPDVRPASDTAAPARFRALAQAYQVLSDPARRAGYDRALRAGAPQHPVPVTVRRPEGPSAAPSPGATPLLRAPGPPLRAGPVRVEASRPAASAASPGEQDARAVALAELTLRWLAGDRGWPW